MANAVPVPKAEARATALLQQIGTRVNTKYGETGVWPALSRDAKAIIEKRTWPGVAARQDTVPLALDFLALDISDFSERVQQYTYIDQYRLSEDSSHELKATFIAQVLRLQRYELYTIQEIATDILLFCHVLATNLGISNGDKSRVFATKFKSRFEYELRDRHRMVHRHERPRLATRMMDAIGATSDKKTVEKVITDIAARFTEILEVGGTQIADAIKTAQERKDLTRQSDDIWQLFASYALPTFSG